MENHSKAEYDECKLPLSLNVDPMDDQSEAHDEYRLLSLNGPIDENEYTLFSLEPMEPIELKEHIEHIEPIVLKEPIENENLELIMEPIEEPIEEPMEPIELKEPIENENPELVGPMEEPTEPMKEPMEPIELKEPMEPIELKEPIGPIELKKGLEQNAETYDECALIEDSVDIEDAKSEVNDECKLLLPSPDELMEELTNGSTLIDDPVGTEEATSEAYDEYKRRLLLPSPDELIELTNVGNKVGNTLVDKVGDNVGGPAVGTEQRPHVRRQKELSNSWR